jgi:hypothetical protein
MSAVLTAAPLPLPLPLPLKPLPLPLPLKPLPLPLPHSSMAVRIAAKTGPQDSKTALRKAPQASSTFTSAEQLFFYIIVFPKMTASATMYKTHTHQDHTFHSVLIVFTHQKTMEKAIEIAQNIHFFVEKN